MSSTTQKETNYLQKGLSIAITIGLAVSSWFLTTAYSQINALDDKVQKVELTQATMSGNRFTSTDFVKAKEIIDQQQLTLDKRITILEENMKTLKEIVLEIRSDVKEMKNDLNK